MEEIYQVQNQLRSYSRSSAAVKKILSDLTKLNDPIYKEYFTADIVHDDPHKVKCTIKAIDGTMYEKLTITLYFIFPLDYPFKPPSILFAPILFHPNIGTDGILDPQLFSDWCPAYTIPLLLIQILSLLDTPHFCIEEADTGMTKHLTRKCVNSFAEEVWDDKVTTRDLIESSIATDNNSHSNVYDLSRDAMVGELSVEEIAILFAAMENDK